MPEIKDLYVIEWMGPYATLEEMYEREGSENCFIYLITGRVKYERKRGIKYVGITDRAPYERLDDNDHRKKQEPILDKQFWAGQYSRVSDNHLRSKRAELVEWCIVRYLALSGASIINSKKKANDPPRPVVVISRWQKKYTTDSRINKPRILSQLPDTILYADGEFWTAGKLKKSI